MSKAIHAHQILNLIDQQPAPLTIGELKSKVATTFGENLVFMNCQDDHFSFDQLVDFMQARQKIVVEDGTVRLNKANICDH